MIGLRAVRFAVLAVFVGGGAATVVAQDRVGWYPTDKSAVVAGFTRGTAGKPFEATATWTTRGRDPKYGDYYTRSVAVELMRDGMGRERMSWAVPEGDARVSLSEKLRTVVVLDPVARCVFLWIEDEAGKGAGAVKVRCEPEGVEVPVRPAWNALSEWEKGELTKSPESKPHFEDVAMGSEEIGGVAAKGFRHEEVRSFDEGKRVYRTNLGQRWYAATLDMVVRTTEGEGTSYFEKDQVSFAISEVKLGEPAAGKFVPPVGVEVEVNAKLNLVGRTDGQGTYLLRMVRRGAAGVGSWPNLSLMAMTDQAGRLVHPAFPEEWYADGPKTALPTFFEGPAEKPFDAIGQLMQYPPDAKTYYDATATIFLNVSRDGAGRARFTFRFLNGGQGQVVYVLDPVAGCMFAWAELAAWEANPKEKSTKLEAKVRCNARGVTMPPKRPWDELSDDEKAQIAKAAAGKLRFVNEKVGDEEVGDRDGERVSAVKYAHYAVHAAEGGKAEKKVKVGEMWYSPELDTVLKMTMVPKGELEKSVAEGAGKDDEDKELMVFEFNSVEAGEPLEDFYPPYGYEIKVDETLLPPFAPAPEAAKK